MASHKCEDCKGTGKILTEGIHIGRYRYDKENGCLVNDIYGKGDWQYTQCPCVGEEEWLEENGNND